MLHDCNRLTFVAEGQGEGTQEVRNERALSVYNRVQHKLTGSYAMTEWTRRRLKFIRNRA
jgi:hypothetical protein